MRQCPTCGKRYLGDDLVVCDTDGSALEHVVMSTDRDRLLNTVIAGSYEVDGVVGDGGMGVVYRARRARDGRICAIKVLRTEYSTDADLVHRFRQEAEAAAAIRHPNIVEVLEFGALPDASQFFVMEYLEGRSLGRLLNDQGRHPSTGKRRPLPEWLAVHIARQICAGLAAAHARSIVHRDLKPDNVHLIVRDGDEHFAKILDFGIAKVQSSKSARTRTGSVFGTPHYMSPEQAQGERNIDNRTDVYALGVLLYEMVTGRVPFDADNMMGVLTAHLYQRPVPPRRATQGAPCSEGVEAIILRALSKQRDGRFDSMEEFGEDLDRLASGQPPLALTYADADTSVYDDPDALPAPMMMAPHALPASASPVTVPAGRISSRSLPAVVMPYASNGETATDPSGPPMVPVATGRSIPPVTGNGLVVRRSNATVLAAALALVGFAAFGAVLVITLRHPVERPNPARGHDVALVQQPIVAVTPRPVPLVSPPPTPDPVVAPAPAPAVDRTSPTIQLHSDPAGAIVRLGRRRIGTTPFEVARPQRAASQTYTLEAPGRVTSRFTVHGDTPSAVEIMMPERESAAGGAHGPGSDAHGASGGPGHAEILDPWAASGH